MTTPAYGRTAAAGDMRIVAGRWRGRTIAAPAGRVVRPTADRVREAWMSVVQPWLPGARVLDLFAGSGALGLEALSRGAAQADFVEQAAPSLRALRDNIAALDAGDRARRPTAPTRSRGIARLAPWRVRRSVRRSAVRSRPRGVCRRALARGAFCDDSGRRALGARDHAAWRPDATVRVHRADRLPRSARAAIQRPDDRSTTDMSPRRRTDAPTRLRTAAIAVYAGSFDPITRGHEDLIRRSLEFVDRLVVAVAIELLEAAAVRDRRAARAHPRHRRRRIRVSMSGRLPGCWWILRRRWARA